jgi:hypothetical protein
MTAVAGASGSDSVGLLVFLGVWLVVALVVAVLVGTSLHRRAEGQSVTDAALDRPPVGGNPAA